MQEIDIRLPAKISERAFPAAIEWICGDLGLDRALRGTLKSYPGSIHWHYKRGKQPGTLEITWWPAKPRLWIKVAAGRSANWIDEIIPLLKRRLEEYNGSKPDKNLTTKTRRH